MPEAQIPAVAYLVLDEEPHLVAAQCTDCSALYFDRREACGRCFGREFRKKSLARTGSVAAYTVVRRAGRGVDTPFTSVMVALDGGGVVKSNLLGTTDPEEIAPRMRVVLDTFSLGVDDEGIEAIAFGFRELKEEA